MRMDRCSALSVADRLNPAPPRPVTQCLTRIAVPCFPLPCAKCQVPSAKHCCAIALRVSDIPGFMSARNEKIWRLWYNKVRLALRFLPLHTVSQAETNIHTYTHTLLRISAYSVLPCSHIRRPGLVWVVVVRHWPINMSVAAMRYQLSTRSRRFTSSYIYLSISYKWWCLWSRTCKQK